MAVSLGYSRFVRQLANVQPTPGGGSAAALSASLGCALGVMVCRLLLRRRALREKKPWLSGKCRDLNCCLTKLLKLVETDAKVYGELVRAQKSKVRVAQAKRRAVSVPREMCGLCGRSRRLIKGLMPFAGPYLASDLRAAEALLRGASSAAQEMVQVNLMSTKGTGGH